LRGSSSRSLSLSGNTSPRRTRSRRKAAACDSRRIYYELSADRIDCRDGIPPALGSGTRVRFALSAGGG
jgi:hypothetical protein